MDAWIMVGLAGAFAISPAIAAGYNRLSKAGRRRSTYIKP